MCDADAVSQDRTKLRWNGWGWSARKDELAAREDVWAWLANELGMPALLATPARPLETITLPPSKLTLEDRIEITRIVGAGQLRDSAFERAFHSGGRRYRDLLALRGGDLATAPDAVVYPRGREEVQAILALAAERGIAVIPFGAGSRAPAPNRGEFLAVIALDISDMDRVIAIDTISHTVEAEAGIYGPALETQLKARGLTLAAAAAEFEFSSLGGWIASGSAKDLVLSATLATSDGTAEDAVQAAEGSAGQFGVITDAVLRVKPIPAKSHSAAYLFPDFGRAIAALRSAAQDGCSHAKLLISDSQTTRTLRDFHRLDKRPGIIDVVLQRYRRWRGLPDTPAGLIALIDGDAASVAFEKIRITAIARRFGGVFIGRGPGNIYRASRFQPPYLRDSLLERGAGVESFTVWARWSNVQAVYDTVRGALEIVLQQTAPRNDARGLVLCHLSDARSDGVALTFSAIFPRSIGADLQQLDTIEAAVLAAIDACGGEMMPGEDERRVRKISKPPRNPAKTRQALKKLYDPNGILRPEPPAS
jgi:FAD/FMN-containing dehydrogenases